MKRFLLESPAYARAIVMSKYQGVQFRSKEKAKAKAYS